VSGDKHIPQRIVSLQPSATVTLRDVGVLDRLVACTKYCADACPEVAQHSLLIVSDSWRAQAEQILATQPDLVLASVPYQVESISEILKAGIRFLALAPRTLAHVYTDIGIIGGVVGQQARSEVLLARMEQRLNEVRCRTEELPKQKVFCEQWGKPIMASQPWVAELVEAAGGAFVGMPGATLDAEDVAAADPDVILAAWCGAGDRVPLEKIVQQRGWQELSAVRLGRVFCIQDELLNTPASTLLGGLNAIACALHPELFPSAQGMRQIDWQTVA